MACSPRIFFAFYIGLDLILGGGGGGGGELKLEGENPSAPPLCMQPCPIPNHPFIPVEFLLHLPHTPTIVTEGNTITLALDQGLLNIHLHNRIPHLSCLRYI